MDKIIVVTNPELGWDCVVGVYKGYSVKEVREILDEQFERDTKDDLIILQPSTFKEKNNYNNFNEISSL